MENGNNPAPAGTADAQADSQVPENLTQAELEDEIGAAFEASLEESEQAEKTEAKPAKDETPESNEEAEKEEPETEEEPEKTEEDEKPPATIKLKDGSEVPLDDLVNGYLRQSDYTKKTQAVAEKERQLESAAQKLLQQHQERNAYGDLALEVLAKYAPKEPDPETIKTDPVGYMQQQAAYQRAKADFEKLAQGRQGVTQQTLEQQRREYEALVAQEQQKLFEAVPELRNKEASDALWNDALKYGPNAWGLTAEKLAGVTDHVAIRVLKSAVAYEKSIVAKRMEAVRKAKEAPPIKTAARPGSNIANARSQKDALERLRNEGTVEAAAATLPDELFN